MKQYLGDGAYVESEGHQLRLSTARSGVRDDEVCLEPEALLELVRFALVTWPNIKRHLEHVLESKS